MQQLFLILFKGPVAWLPLQNKVLYICVDEGRDFLKQKLSGGNVNGDRSIVKLLRASETAHISYNGRMSSLLTALIDARPKGNYGLKVKKKGDSISLHPVSQQLLWRLTSGDSQNAVLGGNAICLERRQGHADSHLAPAVKIIDMSDFYSVCQACSRAFGVLIQKP